MNFQVEVLRLNEELIDLQNLVRFVKFSSAMVSQMFTDLTGVVFSVWCINNPYDFNGNKWKKIFLVAWRFEELSTRFGFKHPTKW